jgi:hypothetical protein
MTNGWHTNDKLGKIFICPKDEQMLISLAYKEHFINQ